MTNLEEQIQNSSDLLKEIYIAVTKSSKSSIPRKCHEIWITRSSLHDSLSKTATILPARKIAWDAVNALAIEEITKTEGNTDFIEYGGVEMDFAVARHLSLVSYIAVTWSVYDRLSNICGRIAGVLEIAEHTRENPKACEHFLSVKKDCLGFAGCQHIKQAYQWPLKLSYKIRNWMVHEGYEEGSIPLFESTRQLDGFRLHSEAKAKLEKVNGYNSENGQIEFCCISPLNEPWPKGDLLEILKLYHMEIDTLFISLLRWSVESLNSQVKAFLERD